MIEIGDQVIGISQYTKGTIGTVLEKSLDGVTLMIHIDYWSEVGRRHILTPDRLIWANQWERYMP